MRLCRQFERGAQIGLQVIVGLAAGFERDLPVVLAVRRMVVVEPGELGKRLVAAVADFADDPGDVARHVLVALAPVVGPSA